MTGGHADRNIIYRGRARLIDDSDWARQQHKLGNTLTVKVAPAEPDHYYIASGNSYIEGANTRLAGEVAKDGSSYTAHLTLDPKVYSGGQSFNIITECDFKPKPGTVGCSKDSITHKVAIEPEKVAPQVRPVLTNLHGYFGDKPKTVSVHGTLAAIDQGKSPNNTTLQVSTDGKQSWNRAQTCQWTGMNFVCDFPVEVPDNHAISLDIKAIAENKLDSEAHVPFDLASFVEEHFLNPVTGGAISDANGVVNIDYRNSDMRSRFPLVGNNKIQIELKAEVKITHAIDNLDFRLILPDAVDKASVQNWSAGWNPENNALWRPNSNWTGDDAGDLSLFIKGYGSTYWPGDYRFTVLLWLDKGKAKSGQYKITLTADAAHSNAVKSDDPDASKQKITKTVTFDIVWE
jgi:hypothetical protein